MGAGSGKTDCMDRACPVCSASFRKPGGVVIMGVNNSCNYNKNNNNNNALSDYSLWEGVGRP